MRAVALFILAWSLSALAVGREKQATRPVPVAPRTEELAATPISLDGFQLPLAKALAALEAGADAVGCFTAFITRGPAFPRRVNLSLLETLEQRRLARLSDLRRA